MQGQAGKHPVETLLHYSYKKNGHSEIHIVGFSRGFFGEKKWLLELKQFSAKMESQEAICAGITCTFQGA